MSEAEEAGEGVESASRGERFLRATFKVASRSHRSFIHRNIGFIVGASFAGWCELSERARAERWK
jgi:hypothetical protein